MGGVIDEKKFFSMYNHVYYSSFVQSKMEIETLPREISNGEAANLRENEAHGTNGSSNQSQQSYQSHQLHQLHQFNQSDQSDQSDQSNQSNASQDFQNSIHETIYKPQSRLFFKANCGCGICYEAVEAAEDAMPMFCCSRQNIVHIHCLVKWCVQKRMEHQTAACPFCRRSFLTQSQFDDIYEWREYDENENNNNSQNSTLYRATRCILSLYPLHTHTAEMRLVRLTMFSYLTMLLNVILLCIIFVFLSRTFSTYSNYTNHAMKYQGQNPVVSTPQSLQNGKYPTKPPPPPLTEPRPKNGITDFDRQGEALKGDTHNRKETEEWFSWRRAVQNVEANWH
jgi:hypothetical protein